ncbi:methyl-accepting chemotaxis protein [Janthinobacterium psychrotolerans]|uniref:Methyl-accepting chemotaxis protein n=1 Tax=Janthinobacterium psychrotolerans TaxID=1747903 RepID=A0A1A7BZP6_9BURK|nr:methyl-accepting chemotaxis protein [Janthinobacterium psychrotolerans]
MDQVTQQNAALVEEAAAAAASLQEQAGALSGVVSVFRLDGVAPAPVRASVPAAVARTALQTAPATRKGRPSHDEWEQF